MVTLVKTIGLAMVDAVNPCALAVMVIVLMTLLLQNPEKRKKVLLGGFSFTLAVFILYFLYGLIMIQFFSHVIPETGKYSFYIFKGFGLFAVVLGVLNIKDYFVYSPGGLATEMPLSMRPRMRLLIKRISSPVGAFFTGIFVTLFLLPCTIGPYIIFSGDISAMNFFKTLPWLFIYNLIFILPMIAITLIIYYGLTTVDEVSGWKERNIKKLHLVEGLILTALGILMITGVI
ncbi:MAG: hypothetical protein ABIH37_00675 [archaeon]